MHPFDHLGAEIATAWSGSGYAPEALPPIAADALRRADLSARLDPLVMVRRFLGEDHPPTQRDIPFGEPQLALFVHPRFVIEALFWVDGAPAIHDHGLRGAFTVLSGSSVHAVYRFDGEDVGSPDLRVGHTELIRLEKLVPGDVRAIDRDLTHGVFHIERPSVSIVVRANVPYYLQYQYEPPHVASRRRNGDSTLDKKIAALRMLADTNQPGWMHALESFLDNAYPYAAYRALVALADYFDDVEGTSRELLSGRWPALAEPLAQSLTDAMWRGDLFARRAHHTRADHRFFLGLLHYATCRQQILDVVAQHSRLPPERQIAIWLRELAESSPSDTLQFLDVALDLSGPLLAPFGPLAPLAVITSLEGIIGGRSTDEVAAELSATLGASLQQASALPRCLAGLHRSTLRPLLA